MHFLQLARIGSAAAVLLGVLAGCGLSFGLFFALTVRAAEPAHPAAPNASAAAHQHPPVPPDASVSQTTTVDGRVLRYTATQGSLPMRDAKGMVIAEVTTYAGGHMFYDRMDSNAAFRRDILQHFRRAGAS